MRNEIRGDVEVFVDEVVIDGANSTRFFFKNQGFHLVAGVILIVLARRLAHPVLNDGSWLGIADVNWFWLAISLTVVHQVLVWLVFRGQLGWTILTRWFGKKDLSVWGLVFLPLLIVRPFLLLGLAISDRGSLGLKSSTGWVLGFGLLLPTFFTFWSVGKYFGVARALGGDHFRLKYRAMPLVRRGAFRWSRNAMYAFAFLGLWSIALFANSAAALILAIFEHAYVWVHYYATEKPDMELIYGSHSNLSS
jgi:hypothetical protein